MHIYICICTCIYIYKQCTKSHCHNLYKNITILNWTKNEICWRQWKHRQQYLLSREDLSQTNFKHEKLAKKVLILSKTFDKILFWIPAVKMILTACLKYYSNTDCEQFIKFVDCKFQERYSKDLWLIRSSIAMKNISFKHGDIEYTLEREHVRKKTWFFLLHLLLLCDICIVLFLQFLFSNSNMSMTTHIYVFMHKWNLKFEILEKRGLKEFL